MDEKRIKEAFADEMFVKKLLELEEPAQVQAAFKEKGIELTETEVIAFRDEAVRLAEKIGLNGELSLEQLDEAAGGVFVSSTVATGLAVVFIGAVAASAVPMVAALGGAVVGLGAVAVAGVVSSLSGRRW